MWIFVCIVVMVSGTNLDVHTLIFDEEQIISGAVINK
jgi:hypothetical protein